MQHCVHPFALIIALVTHVKKSVRPRSQYGWVQCYTCSTILITCSKGVANGRTKSSADVEAREDKISK